MGSRSAARVGASVGGCEGRRGRGSFLRIRAVESAATSGSTWASKFVSRSSASARCAVGVDQHAADFHADAFGADGGDFGGHFLDGEERVGVDCEIERGGEADGAEHAEFVFAKPQAGVADGADDLGLRSCWPST